MQKLAFKPGFTTCPACSIKGVPQEPYMAVPTADGRVYCYACQLVTSDFAERTRWDVIAKLKELPPLVRDAVLSLITTKVGEDGSVGPTYVVDSVGKKGLGFSDPMTEGDTARASAAVAQGAAHYLLEEADRTVVSLSHGPYRFHTVRISFTPAELALAAQSEVDVEREVALAAPLLDRLQALEAKAINSLVACGFKVRGFDIESSMRFVRLLSGSSSAGVSAEVTWIP